MPVTTTWVPILAQFLSTVEQTTGMSVAPSGGDASTRTTTQEAPVRKEDLIPKQLPKGVVLDKDGKPCRSCTSFAAWAAMAKGKDSNPLSSASQNATGSVGQAASTAQLTLPPDCPADVDELGRSTWTMLHTMTANYPPRASPEQQQQTKSFISLFSNMYPCSHCAEDFREWMKETGNGPRVQTRDEFGKWMCEAHNAVNEKLGKAKFDCAKWEERWRTGPPDGRCG